MTKSCQTCVHFRPFRPLSQLLAMELGLDHPDLVTELIKMMQDERQKRDEEAGLKVKLLGDRSEQWPYRPQMSDYCGLKESEYAFLLAELKNRGGRCPDHEAAEGAGQGCDDCTHRRAATGPARDQAVILRQSQLAENAAVLERDGGGPKVDDYRKLVGTRRAFEAAQAYYAGRMTGRLPEYLAVCASFSGERDFVPCVVQNPYARCLKHAPSGGAEPRVTHTGGQGVESPGGAQASAAKPEPAGAVAEVEPGAAGDRQRPDSGPASPAQQAGEGAPPEAEKSEGLPGIPLPNWR